MAKQIINIGTSPNSGNGDPLRTSFTKINQNFTELYDSQAGAVDLGNFKISGNALGTQAVGNPDGWGGYYMYLSPNGEGSTYITIPDDISASIGAALQLVNYDVNGGGVQIQSNTNYWTFKPDGTITLPTLTVNLHNGGNQTGQVLQFGDPDQQVIITGPTPAENANAQRLIIQGQRATGTGEGGDVYFWGGDSQENGGDIKIYAGDADSVTQGYGGYANISGGYGQTQGGDVNINAGSSGTNGGDVSIAAGYGGTLYGNVFLRTNNNVWTLSNDGSLTLPAGGTITEGYVTSTVTNGLTSENSRTLKKLSDDEKEGLGRISLNIQAKFNF